MSSIGYQATQMILGAADKLAVLKQLSQDLPRYAHLLSEVELNTTLTDRIELFRQIAPHDMFLVNGLRLTPAELDPFKLLSHLRKENSIISALEGIGFTQQQALDLIRSEKLAQSEQPEEDVPTFDMRDSTKSVIAWLNDLEKDSRYGMWPKDLRNLARIFTPGQIQRIRQNIVQVVFALDLSSSASWQMILEEVMTNIEHGLPMQFGVVPLIDYTDPSSDSDANKMAKVYNYLRQVFGKKKVMSFWKGAMIAFAKNSGKMSFTENTRGLYAAFVKSTKTKTGDTALSWDQVISLSDEKLAEQWNASVKYCARLDLSTVSSPEGLVFVNGGAISLADNYQNSLFQAVQMQMWELAQALRRTDLDPEGNVQEYVYSRPGVMSTRSALIYPSDESPLRFLPLGEPAVQDWVDNGIPYLSYKSESDLELQTVTVWVVGDFAFAHARELAAKALLAAADDRRVRVGLIHSPQPIGAAASEHRADGEEDEEQPEGFSADMPAAVHQLISVSDVPADVAASFAERLLRSSELDQEILADEQFAAHKDVFAEIVDLSDDTADSSETAFALNQAALHTLGVPATTSSSSYLVVNGRILPPIPDDVPISADTVRALVNYELSERIDNVYKAVEKVTASPDTLNLPSLIMKATAILSHGQSLVKVNGIFQRPWADTRRSIEDLVKGKNDSLIQINDPATARFRIQAVLDPLSEYAQKWAPVFQALASLPSVSVEVYLNPSVGMKELPVKRFYRYLWPSELSFDSDGGVATPEVLFNGVPADPLLTLGMDVPAAWLVTAVESVHDLDNIRLSSVKDKGTGVSATYRLVNILVEGHCVDGGNRSPPRGLEVQLGTSLTPSITDTIVMANLGYLQLKANPGVWEFSIRDGRSNDIYRIDDISEGRWNYVAAKRAQTSNTGSVKPIVLSSFNGITIFPVVSKRAGKESEKLLLEKGAEESIKAASGSGSKGGLWGKLKGAIGGGVATTGDNRPHFD
ncbi:killer toxin resistant protein, partial [Linderina macrospora]